nr:MAG: hypothetical protein [Bacteriophage sp.]
MLVLIDEPKNAISVALLIHQLLNTSETVVISMIRLLREVDYNKYDKTFYFNDAVYNVNNVFARHGVYDIIYLLKNLLTKL